MNNEQRQLLTLQLRTLSRPQLISLTVQKTATLYNNALEQDKDALIAGLIDVEEVLAPVQA